jgi:serine/threonine-protein kinase
MAAADATAHAPAALIDRVAAKTPAAATEPAKAARSPAIVIAVAAVAIAVVGTGAWLLQQWRATDTAKAEHASGANPPPAAAPPASAPAPAAAVQKREPGTLVISAVGLADPSDPRYRSDKALLQGDLRADSRSRP